MFGGNYDRGNVVVNLSYVDSGLVLQSDRNDCPLFEGDNGLECFGSSHTIGGRAHFNDGTEIQFNQVPGGDGDFYEPYNGAIHGFDWFPYLNAVSPMERINVSAFGTYEFSDSVSLFSEILYANRQGEQIVTPRRIADTPVTAAFPYNPTGQDLTLKRRRMVELGAPYFFQETDTLRVVLGLEGSIENGWRWDVAGNYGRNTGRDGWTFDIDNARVTQTLDETICSTAPGAATLVALLAHLVQAGGNGLDSHPQQAAVRFQLGFTRAAQANTAFLPLKVGPATNQPCRQVF